MQDAADLLGMLVYQEFWMKGDNNGRFAGSHEWPIDRKASLANVRDTVLRLCNRPSLFLYAGGNGTFEVHRYLLLCVERHQAAVEKYQEQVLDLCDNLSQSPVVDILAKTMETLPDEGLVHVGAELLGVSLGLLGRWWETGLDGLVEDLVDGTNLDGRYSHYSEEEDEGDKNGDGEGAQVQPLLPPQPYQLTEASRDEKKPNPGMPCCSITGQQMIEPVMAADGHTYEQYAIRDGWRQAVAAP
jgi:hypothetical protein